MLQEGISEIQFPVFVIVGIAAVVVFSVVRIFRGASATLPGPIPAPLIGNALWFVGRDIDKAVVDLHNKFGDVVEVNLMGQKLVIVSGQEHVRHVLSSPGYQMRWVVVDGLKEIGMYEQGIAFNSMMGSWKAQKAMFKSNVGGKFLNNVVPTTINTTNRLVGILDDMTMRAGGSATVNMAAYAHRLALDTIGELAFGQRFDTMSDTSSELASAARDFMNAWVYFVLTPTPVFKYIKKWQTRNHRKAVVKLHDLIDEIIRTRTQLMTAEPDNENLQKDFLGVLVSASLENNPDTVTKKDVQLLVREMLLGGSDTTGSSLSFILYYIAKYPEVQEKMVQEYENVLGGATPTIDTINKLTYTEQVINEVFRICPTTTIIPRRAVEDDMLGQWKIPAGTNIVVNLYSNYVDERYWENPHQFNPDRFAPSSASSYKDILFPFGYGARACPGQLVAKLELKTMLGMLLPKLRFQLVDDHQPLQTVYTIVNHIKDETLMMHVTKRN